MMLLVYIYLFVLGITLGSFYNVVGLRVPNGQSIVRPRSHCTVCHRDLAVIDLIPVVSYFFLKGRCRGCHQKVSPLYPFVEFMTGVLFVTSFLVFGWSLETIVSIVLMSLLVIIFVSDIRYMIIPDKVLLFFAPILLFMRVTFAPLDPWWDAVVGSVIGFTLLLLIAVASRGGMGGGDIKLFAVLGLVLGWQGTLLAFFFSCLYGALIGGVGLLIGKVERRKPIPFGPFIVMGTITSYYFGTALVEWYMRLFL